jgi:soluble lytic murein transglycosylase-like protein
MRMRWRRAGGVLAMSVLAALVWAAPAAAEIVIFSSGRTLSVRSHRIDGASIVLELRGGGEITCQRSLVAEIRPDEMAYPDPAPPMDAAAMTASDGASPFAAIIAQVAARQQVDAQLIRAIIAVESAYVPEATSPKGAMGLMQIMPATARAYHVRNPYDPRANIEAGVRHLKMLLARFPLRDALAAYNAGAAAVERFGGIPPFPETQAYVASVLARLAR